MASVQERVEAVCRQSEEQLLLGESTTQGRAATNAMTDSNQILRQLLYPSKSETGQTAEESPVSSIHRRESWDDGAMATSSSKDTYENDKETDAPPAVHSKEGENDVPSMVISPEDLQEQQREQMEEAIRAMASQMKQETERIHQTLRSQAANLDELEQVTTENVEAVSQVAQDVSEHVRQGWTKSLGTWTMLFVLVGVFVLTLLIILMAPKRRDVPCFFFFCDSYSHSTVPAPATNSDQFCRILPNGEQECLAGESLVREKDHMDKALLDHDRMDQDIDDESQGESNYVEARNNDDDERAKLDRLLDDKDWNEETEEAIDDSEGLDENNKDYETEYDENDKAELDRLLDQDLNEESKEEEDDDDYSEFSNRAEEYWSEYDPSDKAELDRLLDKELYGETEEEEKEEEVDPDLSDHDEDYEYDQDDELDRLLDENLNGETEETENEAEFSDENEDYEVQYSQDDKAELDRLLDQGLDHETEEAEDETEEADQHGGYEVQYDQDDKAELDRLLDEELNDETEETENEAEFSDEEEDYETQDEQGSVEEDVNGETEDNSEFSDHDEEDVVENDEDSNAELDGVVYENLNDETEDAENDHDQDNESEYDSDDKAELDRLLDEQFNAETEEEKGDPALVDHEGEHESEYDPADNAELEQSVDEELNDETEEEKDDSAMSDHGEGDDQPASNGAGGMLENEGVVPHGDKEMRTVEIEDHIMPHSEGDGIVLTEEVEVGMDGELIDMPTRAISENEVISETEMSAVRDEDHDVESVDSQDDEYFTQDETTTEHMEASAMATNGERDEETTNSNHNDSMEQDKEERTELHEAIGRDGEHIIYERSDNDMILTDETDVEVDREPADDPKASTYEDEDVQDPKGEEKQKSDEYQNENDHDLYDVDATAEEAHQVREGVIADDDSRNENTTPNDDESISGNEQQSMNASSEATNSEDPEMDASPDEIPLFRNKPFSPEDVRKAAAYGDVESLEGYLKIRSDWGQSADQNAWTAWHLAARRGDTNAIAILKKAFGGISTLRSVDGLTALDVAIGHWGRDHVITQMLSS